DGDSLTAWYPYDESKVNWDLNPLPDRNIQAGSGTNVVPRGALSTAASQNGPTDGTGNVTGLAFLPVLDPNDDDGFSLRGTPEMYVVSDNGGIYRVTNYQSNDNARMQLLNDLNVQFTGLTPGPENVEGGRYKDTLFATDNNGNIWALDRNGQP